MKKTIMEKADEILQQFGLSDTAAEAAPVSTVTEHTVGKSYSSQPLPEVTNTQASELMVAAGVISEKEEVDDTRAEGSRGRESGRTTARRRQSKKGNEPPETMEKSSKEEAEALEDKEEKEGMKIEGSGGVKNLGRKQKALDRDTNASIASEFDWNQEGESPEARDARLAAARTNTATLQKKRVANAGRLGRKQGEGAGRPLLRKVGALNASKKWRPVLPRVENLGTTVGNFGMNFAPKPKSKRLTRKRKVAKESKSFNKFINEVFKNV